MTDSKSEPILTEILNGKPLVDSLPGWVTLDQVSKVRPGPYESDTCTLVPPQWQPAAAAVANQSTYDLRISELFPELAHIMSVPGVTLVGPAAAAGITSRFRAGIADLRVPFPLAAAAADRVREAVRREMASPSEEQAAVTSILEAAAAVRSSIEMFQPGFLTIPAARPGLLYRLHFGEFEPDVDLEQVMYDGVTASMSYTAAYAHVHRVSVARPPSDPATPERYCSYFVDGYALAFPGLELDGIGPRRLPQLVLQVDELHGSLAVGSIAPAAAWLPSPLSLGYPFDISSAAVAASHHNLEVFAAEREDYIFVAERIDLPADPGQTPGILLPPDGIAALVNAILEQVYRRLASKGSLGSNRETLDRYLHVPSYVMDLAERTRNFRDFLLVLQPSISELMRQTHRRIGWHRETPPRRCSWQKWYGAAASCRVSDTARQLATLRGLLSRIVPTGTVYAGECALCHSSVRTGAPGTLILSCGHQFHWSGPGCPGYAVWARAHDECPVCRHSDKK